MTTTHEAEKLLQIPIEKIAESALNPRRRFDPARMAELVESVREHGVITPLLARPTSGKKGQPSLFELAAGHRRLRAAREAGLATVPCIVRAMDDRSFAEVLNLENLQRQGLDELDEAEGFRQLRDLAGYDVATIALKLSRSQKYVYDRLKLLDLVPEAQDLLRGGMIHAGHAILLARLDPKDQARAIDPKDIALFDYEVPDRNGLYEPLELEEAERDQPTAGKPLTRWRERKAKTVRELEAWINANVRFDREHVDPVYHPETARTLFETQQAEEPLRVVPITRFFQVPASARGEERTLCRESWRRADGAEEYDIARGRVVTGKTCEHAVTGVVVVGPGRGEVFDICTDKKLCRVHWKDNAKAAHQRRTRAASVFEEQDAKRKQLEQAAERAFPKIEAHVRERVAKMDLDIISKRLLYAFRGLGTELDVSDAECDSILKRCRDGYHAIVELYLYGRLREASYSYAANEHLLKFLDGQLGGNKCRTLFDEALKDVRATAKREARAAAKKAEPAAKAGKPKGRPKRAGRARSALPLVLALAGALVLLALAGCNGPAWQRVASSLEVGAGTTDHRADDALGNPIYADSTQLWVTLRPLAFMEPPTQVVIVKKAGE